MPEIRSRLISLNERTGGVATLLSLLALFATFYQLYLQRTHNEKSLKPLPQIVLGDHGPDIFLHIRNNGVGPLIVESLTFTKNGKVYSGIEECLDLPPRSYMHVRVTSTAKIVILPGAVLELFFKHFDDQEEGTRMDEVRQQLSELAMKVDGRDIFDKKIFVERDFDWFSRHTNFDFVCPNIG
ncbi:hypothetical protein LZD49_34165 [Dyadobacter sp. CY261]|uniref:hypothetical protein n=1 Tax=Dyadobacter sp. CY261 TaxID=2907203 RepID=UPI001F4153C6|nr:hypothetical protein [Dyadobacter sp. CY261]MCF0075570.1 hypothetical protein [Dyadobacter sp. CY261]